MHTARLTITTHEQGMPSSLGAPQRTRRWETPFATVSWDYPPSLAAYDNALLARGASHSRFLRIAYLSTRERSSTSAPSPSLVSLSPTPTPSPLDTPTVPSSRSHLTLATPSAPSAGSSRTQAVHLSPVPPSSFSRPCTNVTPRSANPLSHTFKCRKPQWPRPPHYHASLLRSPLSRRKGLFRAILAPNKAVDFFRWDVLLGPGLSLSAPRQERRQMRTGGVDAFASLHVAESVLEPYEAAAGFFGWHGLGLDVNPRAQGNHHQDIDVQCYWSKGAARRPGLEHNVVGDESRPLDLQIGIDEMAVDEGRARWARTAEELVGPPGLVSRWVVEVHGPDTVTAHLDLAPKRGAVVSRAPSSISSSCELVRWDPDIGTVPSRSSRLPLASDEKVQLSPSSLTASVLGSVSSSKSELDTDSPSRWWYGPSSQRGPLPAPHLPSLRFPPVQYGPPPTQFSPYFLGSPVTSAQGQGCWYGAHPIGAPSSVNRDPNLVKSLPPHPHIFTTPVTPAPMHSSQSLRPTRPGLERDEYRPGRDCDKETETDHGYESTTTTTDSEPPPHTPIGAATTSHCVEGPRIYGDDEVDGCGVEANGAHAVASVTIGLSVPITPVKLLGRFSTTSPSPPSVSSGFDSPDLNRADYESSKAAVVFPSLNGTFRQGLSSQTSVVTTDQGISTQTTVSSAKEMTPHGLGGEENSNMQPRSGGSGHSTCSVLGDSPAFMSSLCPPPPTSPSSGLRKDSQGFWETVAPISPCSSSYSLPISPSEGKAGPRLTTGWVGEKKGSELPDTASSQFIFSAKSRSLSPGPRRVTNVGSTHSSGPKFTSYFSPTSTPASTSVCGSSYPSSPSPPENSFLVPPNSTTLFPAFLATANAKRKKASRTREIVDRLRSSSVDVGKEWVGADSSGWLACPGAGGEVDGKLPLTGLDHAAGSHVPGGQLSHSPPPKPGSDSTQWMGSTLGKSNGHATSSKSSDSSLPGSGVKSNGVTAGSETVNPGITPFPILSVSQSSASSFTVTHQNQAGGATVVSPGDGGGSKMNATLATSPNTRNPGTPNGSASSSAHPYHPLSPPSHPTAHPQPALGPPPMLAVPAYSPPVYVPFAQYRLAPPPQGQQGQGPWLALYPARPPHLPMHPVPAQTHAPPITGVSGMRHVSW